MAFVAGLAAIALCPDSADAACGDYVMVRGRLPSSHGAMQGSLSRASHHSEIPAVSESGGESSPGKRVPTCRGTHCSDGSIPPVAPTPKLQSTLERWACSLSSELADPIQSSSFFSEPDVVLTQGTGLSILRPPR